MRNGSTEALSLELGRGAWGMEFPLMGLSETFPAFNTALAHYT